MPEPASNPRDILGETMAESRKTLMPHLAALLKTNKIVEVPPDEERRQVWQAAITDEQEAQLWQQAMAERGLSPQMANDPAQAEQFMKQMTDIGLGIAKQKYPGRFDMLGQEGRDTQAQQANWAWKHAQHGPPKAMQEGEQDVS